MGKWSARQQLRGSVPASDQLLSPERGKPYFCLP